MISLSWRTLKGSYHDQISYSPWAKEDVDKAEETWRKYLLQESFDLGPYEHHMFFLDYVEKGPNMPNGFQWYSLRATDASLVSNIKTILVYTHFPWMFFVSTIHPTHLSGWHGTRIKVTGEITRTFSIEDTLFGNFLINRAKKTMNMLAGPIDNRVLDSLAKNPERFLNSQSFEVMMVEAKRERQAKKRMLPKGITALIDIIERSMDNPELNPLQQKWVYFVQSIIADSLASVPEDKAIEIHSLLESTISQSDITKPDRQYDFKTNEIIGRFMVNFCGSKDEQLSILDRALNELIKKRNKEDRRFLVVFSFNPLDAEYPFETLYIIE